LVSGARQKVVGHKLFKAVTVSDFLNKSTPDDNQCLKILASIAGKVKHTILAKKAIGASSHISFQPAPVICNIFLFAVFRQVQNATVWA
jgi:hypothetical protein